MDVAVEPAVERAEPGAHQDEGFGYPSSLQEAVQVIHHPGKQHWSISAQNQDILQTGSGRLETWLGGTKTRSMKILTT